MDDRELGLSFGSVAAAYAQHRPGYAPAALDWVIGAAPWRRVLDLGAGTGKLAAALVELGAEVVAVEPDAAMLAQLRAELPGVHALPGSASRSRCRTRASTRYWPATPCTGST